MLSPKDPLAPTHKNNKAEICSNLECHPKASPSLAGYQVHPGFNVEVNPKQYYFRTFFIMLTGGTLLPLMGIMFLDLFRRLFPNSRSKRRK